MNAAAHQERLWRLIAEAQPGFGGARTLRRALRDGFMACPRHRFLHRFRPPLEAELRDVTARSLRLHLPTIYVDSPLVYGPGERTTRPAQRPAATCSQPSFVLHLLERLDPQPGQRILEIGSGGGWVAGMLGHAVGRAGAVVGIERLKELAAESRANLRRCGIANVTIRDGDGAQATAARGGFDRILVSAGAGTVPRAWLEQLTDGGLLVVPLHVPGGGEEVYVLRRCGRTLRSEGALPAWFVPLVGSAGPPAPLDPAEDAAVRALLRLKPTRIAAWFGGTGWGFFQGHTAPFRSYLHKTEPGFRAIQQAASHGMAFGLIDRAKASLALCRPEAIEAYGTRAALDRLTRACCRWTGRFMPPGTAFALTISFDGKTAPPRYAWTLEP
jgi:protein-L-isoaspartate(D-aspartate) O-methyltransferase